MRLTAVILVSLILVSSAGVMAGTPRSHDGGVFLRLSGGFGYAGSKAEGDYESADFSGGTGDMNFAIGGMVRPNLAVHATLMGWMMTGPELELCDPECDTVSDEDISFSLNGIGGGITYYFMPANYYISASICAANLTFEYQNVSVDSDYGVAFDITAGKEWWVSDGWGIGVSGAFGYHSITDEGDTWSGKSFGVRFSATYN